MSQVLLLMSSNHHRLWAVEDDGGNNTTVVVNIPYSTTSRGDLLWDIVYGARAAICASHLLFTACGHIFPGIGIFFDASPTNRAVLDIYGVTVTTVVQHDLMLSYQRCPHSHHTPYTRCARAISCSPFHYSLSD